MSGREKRLALFLLVAVGGIGGLRVVWPAIQGATVKVADDNRELEEEIFDLEDDLESVVIYQDAYKDYLARTGSTNPDVVRDNMHGKLMELTRRAKLADVTVTPKRPGDFKPVGSRRKTEIKTVGFTVRADAKLDQAIGFLQSFYELPYIAQITDLKLVPKTSRRSSRGPKGPELVNMTATVQALIPPADPLGVINPELLQQPDSRAIEGGKDYAMIWRRDPFKEYVPPPPPPPPPPKKQERPKPPPPKKQERPKPPPPPPPPPPKPVGDPQRTLKQVRMTLLYGYDEALVVNPGNGSSEYVGVGDQLDGGEVLMVHSLGPITRREDKKIRFYPLGQKLAGCVEIDQAADKYPEVVYAFDEVRDELIPPEPEEEQEPEEAEEPQQGDEPDDGAQQDEDEKPAGDNPKPDVKPSGTAKPPIRQPTNTNAGKPKVRPAGPAVGNSQTNANSASRTNRSGAQTSATSAVLSRFNPFGLQSSPVKPHTKGVMPDPKLLINSEKKTLADVIRSAQNRGTTNAPAANRARKSRPRRNAGRPNPTADKKTQR